MASLGAGHAAKPLHHGEEEMARIAPLSQSQPEAEKEVTRLENVLRNEEAKPQVNELSIARLSSALAFRLRQAGRFEEARVMQERVVSIERGLSDDDLAVAELRRRLGVMVRESGEPNRQLNPHTIAFRDRTRLRH